MYFHFNVAIFLLILRLSDTTYTIGKRNETVQKFIKRLFENYEKEIPPSLHTGTPTIVRISIYIHTISSISAVEMDYSVNMFLRQYWRDERLTFANDHNESISLNSMKNRLWVPDLYFINEKVGHFHKVTTPNLLIRLSPNGDIMFSQKLTIKLSCPMHLSKFPLDKQNCTIKLESYGYFTSEVVFEWVEDNTKAVEFSKEMELPEFYTPEKETGPCTLKYMTGSYSCLYLKFVLRRKFGYYVTQTYIPTVLIVILSWVSFWIDVTAVPARISLGLLTVLSMTTQSSGARGELPRVSYVKAIDVWMITCMVFVFGALIEYAVANVMERMPKKSKSKNRRYPFNHNENHSIIHNETFREEVPLCLCTPPSSANYHGARMRFRAAQSESEATHEASRSMYLVHNHVPGGMSSPERTNRMSRPKISSSSFIDGQTPIPVPPPPPPSKLPITTSGVAPVHHGRGTMIDSFARKLFPATFIAFNIFYWVFYLYIV